MPGDLYMRTINSALNNPDAPVFRGNVTPFLFFLLILATALPAFAQMEVWIGVTRYRTYRIPLIVRDFEGEGELAASIRETVRRDLALSGFFDIMESNDPDSARASSAVVGEVIVKDGILEGKIRLMPGGEEISGKRYKLGEAGPRKAAHDFADDVIFHLTGEFGISRTRIAFVRSNGRTSDLCVVDWDGYNLEWILSNGSNNLTPEWAPRGKKLLYTSYIEGDANLYWLDRESGEGGPVVSSYGVNSSPAWSPDGKRIAFMMTGGVNADIYLIHRDGTGLRRLTHHRAIDTEPTWAPGGRHIAFTSDRSGSPQIYRMNSDGSDVKRLTFEGSYNGSPKWSPQGDRIAYVSRQEGGFQIRVLDLRDEESYLLTFQSGNNEDPEWSPDGRHIVFSSTRTGRRKLYVMHADGSGVRLLAPGETEDYTPSWSARP